MIDLTTAELDLMYEASKHDHNPVVGSEVRQMIGMIRRSAARIEQLEAALRWIADIEQEYEYHGTLNAQVVRILETARATLAPETDK